MNESLLLWINQGCHTPELDVLFSWVSEKNTFSFPLLGIIILFLGFRYGKSGWLLGFLMLLVVGTGDLLGNFLKSVFAQPRPCLELWELIRMPHAESTRCMSSESGMPSNHALNFFATFSFLSFFIRRHTITILSIVLCTLVALSRVYLGEHFPSQVISGALIGIAYGLTIALVCRHYFSKMLDNPLSTFIKK